MLERNYWILRWTTFSSNLKGGNSSLFIVFYLLTASLFFAIGLCLLISPRAYFALLDRMAGVNLWASQSSSFNPNAPRWRALGGGVMLFSVFLVVGPILSFYLRSPEEFRAHVQAHLHSSHLGVSWWAVVVLLLFLFLGLGFLIRPMTVMDRVSPRELSSDPEVHQRAYILRIFGALLLLVSLLGIRVQILRHFRH
jgi:hypothetical protein